MGPVWAFSMCMSSSLGIHTILHLPAEFRPNKTIRDIDRTSYPFSRWQPWHRNSTSGLVFRELTHLRKSKHICIPNFGEISQSTAAVLLLSFSETLLPVLIFTFASQSACHSAFAYKFRRNQTTRDRVMASFPVSKTAATSSQFYFRFRFL